MWCGIPHLYLVQYFPISGHVNRTVVNCFLKRLIVAPVSQKVNVAPNKPAEKLSQFQGVACLFFFLGPGSMLQVTTAQVWVTPPLSLCTCFLFSCLFFPAISGIPVFVFPAARCCFLLAAHPALSDKLLTSVHSSLPGFCLPHWTWHWDLLCHNFSDKSTYHPPDFIPWQFCKGCTLWGLWLYHQYISWVAF